MRFDKEMPKRRRRKKVEEPAEEEPGELEESVEAEEVPEPEPEAPVAEAPEVVEETKEKIVYEEVGKEKYTKGYICAPTKKGFCQLRERTKAVYGIKYAAGKGVDMAKKAKIAVMDWCKILPRKGSAERKDKEDLV